MPTKTIQEIDDELAELYGSHCLDDDYERREIAEYVHDLLTAERASLTRGET